MFDPPEENSEGTKRVKSYYLFGERLFLSNNILLLLAIIRPSFETKTISIEILGPPPEENTCHSDENSDSIY